jgi:hypothetical protein
VNGEDTRPIEGDGSKFIEKKNISVENALRNKYLESISSIKIIDCVIKSMQQIDALIIANLGARPHLQLRGRSSI